MEQFVLAPLSVYNSSNNPTIVTKQGLPKYKPEETPRYYKDTLKKEINEQLSTSASPQVNKTLVSSHQAIKFQHFDSGWNRDWCAVEGLCTAFEAQKRTRTRYLLYLTQPASLPILLSTVMPNKEEFGSLSKSEQKLQRLYTQGFAAYGSVRSLAKAAKLSPSKVREFLYSKTSYTNFTQATRKFKRMRAFARFKNEIWCMDIAYVDKLAKDNNGVKYLLVRQDLFDITVDPKVMKTKDSKEAVKTFSEMITKKSRPKKTWVDQGTEFAGEFKKFCSAEGRDLL